MWFHHPKSYCGINYCIALTEFADGKVTRPADYDVIAAIFNVVIGPLNHMITTYNQKAVQFVNFPISPEITFSVHHTELLEHKSKYPDKFKDLESLFGDGNKTSNEICGIFDIINACKRNLPTNCKMFPKASFETMNSNSVKELLEAACDIHAINEMELTAALILLDVLVKMQKDVRFQCTNDNGKASLLNVLT